MKLKILAVDDEPLTLMVLGEMLERMGHVVVPAANGREAIERYQSEAPDLVLMDVTMPEMDGYAATVRIRELDPDRWVPVILVTALNAEEDYLKGFEVGGDDYLVKPISKVILRARIAAATRLAQMHRRMVEDARQLAARRAEDERELVEAKQLISKLTAYDSPMSGLDLVSLYELPAAHFSGDVFLCAATPAGELNLMLADGTGRGLSAALNVIPLVEVFHGMSSKGFSLESVAWELNRKVRQLMPPDRLIAVTLVSVNLAERLLTVWNAGNPPAIAMDAAGTVSQRWESDHPPLGVLSDEAFCAKPTVWRWDRPVWLYLYSDGLIEARDPEGARWEQQSLERVLAAAAPDNAVAAVVAALAEHRGDAPPHDDITLACISCPVSPPAERHALAPVSGAGHHDDGNSGYWKMELRLTAVELRKIDVVPMFLGWVEQLGLKPAHRGKVFLVFTELFNNALDHGILQLDATIKQEADGMNRYFAERRRRLAELAQGIIDIEVARLYCDGSEMLSICVKDSGRGFDAVRAHDDAPELTRPFGRGLVLVRSLCHQLDFDRNGSEVTALYALN